MERLTHDEQAVQLGPRDVLNEVPRQGARQMLAAAIENEVAEYIAAHAEQRDAAGLRLVVRNGHLLRGEIQTGLGPIGVRQARVNDERTDIEGNRIFFTSKILPPHLRRTKKWVNVLGIPFRGDRQT